MLAVRECNVGLLLLRLQHIITLYQSTIRVKTLQGDGNSDKADSCTSGYLQKVFSVASAENVGHHRADSAMFAAHAALVVRRRHLIRARNDFPNGLESDDGLALTNKSANQPLLVQNLAAEARSSVSHPLVLFALHVGDLKVYIIIFEHNFSSESVTRCNFRAPHSMKKFFWFSLRLIKQQQNKIQPGHLLMRISPKRIRGQM